MEGVEDEFQRYNEMAEKLQLCDIKNDEKNKVECEKSQSSNILGNGDNHDVSVSEKNNDLPSTSKPAIQLNGRSDEEEETESSDEESSSDDEPIRAPLELLGEFIQYVRCGNWTDAQKLCKMILIYEPDHQMALQYQVIIQEKMEIEKELAEMESSSEEESSSDEDTSEEEVSNDEEEEQEDEEEEDEDHREHLPNKLIFFNDDVKPWVP